jgi:hypothetical protein
MNYSICLLDAGGRTLRTELSAYSDDAAALVRARTEVVTSPIVEVWKGELLLTRLLRQPLAEAEN